MTLKETKREKETKFRKEGARSTVEGGRREEEGRQGVREAGRNGGGDIDESPVAQVTRWINEETDIKYRRKSDQCSTAI